jgi:hypothetical protein
MWPHLLFDQSYNPYEPFFNHRIVNKLVTFHIRTRQCLKFRPLSIMSRLAIGRNFTHSVRIMPDPFPSNLLKPLVMTETTPPIKACLVEWRHLSGVAIIVASTPAATSSGSIPRAGCVPLDSKGVPKSIWRHAYDRWLYLLLPLWFMHHVMLENQGTQVWWSQPNSVSKSSWYWRSQPTPPWQVWMHHLQQLRHAIWKMLWWRRRIPMSLLWQLEVFFQGDKDLEYR